MLLAPASSFLKMVAGFTWRRIGAYLLPKVFLPSFGKWCVAPGNSVPDGMLDLMGLAMKHYRFTSAPLQPDVYTDAELSRIETPCLLLVGDHEVIYNPEAAVARATRLVKNLKATIIRGASHALVMERPDAVNAAIGAFIGNRAIS